MSDQLDFRRVFEESLEAQVVLDTDGLIVSASDGYLHALGKSREAVSGRALLSLPPYSQAAEAAGRLRNALIVVQRSAVSLRISLEDAQAPSGDALWSSAVTRPLMEAGRVCYFVHALEASVMRSEQSESHSERRLRKLSEELQRDLRDASERLRVALSAARAMSWDRDLVTEQSECSSEYQDFSGLPPGQPAQLLGTQLVHPEDRARVEEATRRCRETGHDLNVEFRGPDRDSQPCWYAAHGQVTRAADGRPLRMVGVTWDVTKRRRLDDDRVHLEQRMQESQKLESLGVLAGGVAHDFNNILMAILGNANLARLEVGANHTALTHLCQIEDASQRAADLCRQMLAYAGKGRFILAHTNLNALIEETTYLLRVSLNKKTTLRLHLASLLPAVIADMTQLRQVLMNLVINASDAIGERSGVISIRTSVVHADRVYLARTFLSPEIPEGSYVSVEVSDTGSGMSQETQARIFEPFFSTKFAGRGLGLAAVLGIVRGHNGALKVYSELGKGTSFKLLLPVASEQHGVARVVSEAVPQRAERGLVLVVDDDPTVSSVACRMLEVLGFETLTAADGRQALAIYRARGAEILAVLVDLTMPNLDGEETFRELRRLNENVRVLLMSGFNEQDATFRFIGKGLAGFVQKPFSLDDLRGKVSALVEQPARR